ncbi:MAG: MFS transporter [Clostridia bacterium]
MSSWRAYPLAVRRLITARAMRSLGQGMMVVNFALYLKALGWHAASIGILLTASGLAGAALSLGIGYLSDRYGRRRFILMYEVLTIAAGVAAILTWNPYVISTAAIVASFGRGQNGGAGPFAPAEQAWIARVITPELRSRIFSLNAAVGFVGMGFGAAAASSVVLFQHFLPGAAAFRPLFALPAIGSAINLFLIYPLREQAGVKTPSTAVPAPSGVRPRRVDAVSRQENWELAKLSFTNLLNGLAVGLTGPLISYWFAARFGVSPAAIGGLMAVSFLGTGFSNLLTGRVAERWGVVRTVSAIRLVGVVTLVLMALMGNFVWAAIFYFVRSILNRGSVGARQAVTVSLTRDERRGFASSLNMFSMRVPASVGPTVAGYLMEDGNLTLPFFIGAGLQTAYAITYAGLFRRYNTLLAADTGAADAQTQAAGRQAGP